MRHKHSMAPQQHQRSRAATRPARKAMPNQHRNSAHPQHDFPPARVPDVDTHCRSLTHSPRPAPLANSLTPLCTPYPASWIPDSVWRLYGLPPVTAGKALRCGPQTSQGTFTGAHPRIRFTSPRKILTSHHLTFLFVTNRIFAPRIEVSQHHEKRPQVHRHPHRGSPSPRTTSFYTPDPHSSALWLASVLFFGTYLARHGPNSNSDSHKRAGPKITTACRAKLMRESQPERYIGKPAVTVLAFEVTKDSENHQRQVNE